MKVVPKKYNTDEVLLSCKLTKHLTKVLKPKFDFIIEPAPEVTFFMCDDEMSIKEICFEAIDFNTAIVVNDETVILELPNGACHLLLEHDGFEALLSIEEEDLYELDTTTKEYLAHAKEECAEILEDMEIE